MEAGAPLSRVYSPHSIFHYGNRVSVCTARAVNSAVLCVDSSTSTPPVKHNQERTSRNNSAKTKSTRTKTGIPPCVCLKLEENHWNSCVFEVSLALSMIRAEECCLFLSMTFVSFLDKLSYHRAAGHLKTSTSGSRTGTPSFRLLRFLGNHNNSGYLSRGFCYLLVSVVLMKEYNLLLGLNW